MPLRQDVTVWRGNNAPAAVWAFESADELANSSFRLAVSAFGEPLITEAEVILIDPLAKTVSWLPTLSESRLVPLGKVSTYELERRAGGIEETVRFGAVIGRGGANQDADVPLVTDGTLDFSSPDSSGLTMLGWI